MSYRKRGYGNRSYGSRGYTQRGSSGPAPVEEGKEYEANITEMSRRGDGIAKIQGFIVFVSGAKTGDNVKFRVTRVGRRFAEAEVVQ
ncbi:MAG: TRAM domain-containing protein [Candidatus Bathyarchaeota archaeon]|nr:TRAM domain-containing protein [Candidatus Bathyarchaeota archaeon]